VAVGYIKNFTDDAKTVVKSDVLGHFSVHALRYDVPFFSDVVNYRL
jgi:hypothetical protein